MIEAHPGHGVHWDENSMGVLGSRFPGSENPFTVESRFPGSEISATMFSTTGGTQTTALHDPRSTDLWRGQVGASSTMSTMTAHDAPRGVMSPSLYPSGGSFLLPTSSTLSPRAPFEHGAFDQRGLVPGPWTIRTCRACGDVLALAEPSISCEICSATVHGHCAMRKLGRITCTTCASQLDFQLHQHRAEHMLAAQSMRLGRIVQGAGSLTGQALGAVATTTAAGAARLVAGVAGGAQSALQAARAI